MKPFIVASAAIACKSTDVVECRIASRDIEYDQDWISLMLRIPKGMTPDQYFVRLNKRRAAAKEKHELLRRARPNTLRYSRTRLRDELDDLFQFWVKLRDRRRYGPLCRICEWRRGTVAYHFVPKCTSNYIIRWHEENACLSCGPCNNGERWHRQRYREKHIEMVGLAKREELERMSRGASGMGIKEMLERREEIRNSISRLR